MLTISTKSFSDIGPVLDDQVDNQFLSIRWGFHDITDETYHGMHELLTADTTEKRQKAIHKIAAPSLNILYANQAGDIGYKIVYSKYGTTKDPTVIRSAELFTKDYRPRRESPPS